MTTDKPSRRPEAEPPEATEAEEDTALRTVIEREPEPGDLVIDPPEAVERDEEGKP